MEPVAETFSNLALSSPELQKFKMSMCIESVVAYLLSNRNTLKHEDSVYSIPGLSLHCIVRNIIKHYSLSSRGQLPKLMSFTIIRFV